MWRGAAIEVRLRLVRNVEARRGWRLQLICWNVVVLLTSHHLILRSRSKSGLSWLVAVGGSSHMKHRDWANCLALVVTRLDTPELRSGKGLRLMGQDVVWRVVKNLWGFLLRILAPRISRRTDLQISSEAIL